MEKPNQKGNQKVGKVFLIFTGICILALPFVVLSAFSFEPKEMEAAAVETQNRDFDNGGNAVFARQNRITGDYMAGISTERTLSEYYARRQYPGSPPFIPHKVEGEYDEGLECLTCHAKGGWAEEFQRNTPLTPHPEQMNCRQCHVRMETDQLFVANGWMSVPPPRLGRAYLPGAPPPIPHDLQMRGDCIACHVGPGAVTDIRVDHPSRGNCSQCHVPDLYAEFFKR